ncbi:hypothetical protein Ddc_18942 [Ditylenchus destructor]|nr:hypothetical protein Ddc_18942 [Ditylenchus destructor]
MAECNVVCVWSRPTHIAEFESGHKKKFRGTPGYKQKTVFERPKAASGTDKATGAKRLPFIILQKIAWEYHGQELWHRGHELLAKDVLCELSFISYLLASPCFARAVAAALLSYRLQP